MKKKLIISSFNLDYGGIEKSLINLLKNLDLSKYDVTVVLENKNGAFLKDVDKNIKVKEYKPNNNKIFLFRKMINLFKKIGWTIFNYHKYDISICYATYSMASNFIARISSKNRIFYIHSNYYEIYDHDISKIKEFFDIRHLDDYQKIIFVSNEAKNDFLNIYPKYQEKSLVINNIVDINEIKTKSLESCTLPVDNKYVGIFIGRLEEDVKRISTIINLAKQCQDNKKEVGFVIVGDGKDKSDILELIKKNNLNNIELVGAQINPYKYLAKGNFLILTSKYEGYPVVYSEAIVLEKPILTTLSITDDEIKINNNFGIVCDVDKLYENIDNIIKFKNSKIDFEEVNKKRIKKIEELIEDVYEK